MAEDRAALLEGMVGEIEEAAQLCQRGWLIETGGDPDTVGAEEQNLIDLGISAGMQATFEVLARRGLFGDEDLDQPGAGE